ncbi:sulfite exporter TauE/SafE family protein [Nonomuraea sp. N2-4H]|uniref:sulfite exporter TauE/SafE family protein n=1 Tax=Nonomuraea sp. N2-4H TaxID=3128898 RepID=UPI003254F7AC
MLAGTATCTAAQGGLLIGLADGRRGRDPALVGWFLAGRLASHTAAGALLGLLGSAVSLPPQARAVLLVAAGVTVVVFAVRLIRRGRATCEDHAAGTDSAGRSEARAEHTACSDPAACAAHAESRQPGEGQRQAISRWRAPLLGAATILVPCGVTLGMEMVAISSGSPLAGAAVMAGFVAGTAPAFALLGYVLRRISRTRLARAAGVVALAAGLWTAGSGISLGGWLAAPAPAEARPHGPAPTSVTVWATRDGYRPAMVDLRANTEVEVVFEVLDRGCTDTVVIDGRDVALPATVRLPPRPAGTLRYVCGMGMYAGFINFS